MWDTVQEPTGRSAVHLSHDLPCRRCGHAVHTFLACSDTCACTPCGLPGDVREPALAGV